MVVAFIAVALVSLPFWMSTALRLALPEDTVSYRNYERIGYSRFALEGVQIEVPQATVQIDRVESYAPIPWFWRAFQNKDSDPYAIIGSVQLVLNNSGPDTEDESSTGPANLFEALEMARSPLALASEWVPYVTVDSLKGTLEEKSFELRNVVWKDSKLELVAVYDQFSEYEFELMAEMTQDSAVLSINSEKANLKVVGKLDLEPDSANLLMELDLKEDHLEAIGRFDRSGWLPLSASWTAQEWSIESGEYGLSGPYESYGFSIEGEWENGSYRNILSGRATPMVDEALKLPPLDFKGTVSGNEERLRIEDFSLSGPGIQANTVEPIGLVLGNLELTGEVKFDIDLDLSIFSIENLRGRLSGGAFLSADEEGTPRGRFSLKGSGVEYEDLKSGVLELEAGLDWPNISIESLDVILEAGSRIGATGAVDIENRMVSPSQFEIEISEAVLEKIVPDGFVIKEVRSSAAIEGPFDAIEHSGSLSVGYFEMEAIKPLGANLVWEGESRMLDRFSVEAVGEEARLEISGKGSWILDQLEMTLDSLTVETHDEQLASLASPSQISLSLGEQVEGSVSEFSLSGQDSKVSIDTVFSYPTKAKAALILEGLDTVKWLDPWLAKPISNVRIDRLDISAGWDDGPIVANGNLDAVVSIEESELTLNGAIALANRVVNLDAFAISDTEGPLLQLEGKLPYEIDPSVEGYILADPDASMAFSMDTSDSPTIIALLNTFSPIEIESMSARALFDGTIRKPQGSLDLSLLTKEGEGEYGTPSASIAATAKIDGSHLQIEDLSVQVLKQTFEATLGIMLPKEALQWISLDPVQVDWKETQFDFSSPNTSLAPIAFFVPQILTASGSFESQFSGSAKEGFSGFISIDDLSTRPIFPFGSFRNIQTRLKLDRTIATLESFKGDIGREPMSMSGKIDFQDIEDLSFAFAVKGDNLPILRQAGLLLRSDLDVVASKDRGSEASIKGEIVLKEGLFLMDTSALSGSGGGGQSAASRPPYFSVDVPPFADWGLEIAVKGDRFMRLQTPAATGVLSMDMELKGSLKEPLAIGRVEFENGSLVFPFASFDLTEGLIELRIDDPYTPVLSLIGEGRRFRYDIGIEVLGSAFDPRIRFTSSPPLSSEQILLMVMAGDVPDESFSYSASQRASKIGTYLSQGLLSSGGGEGLGSRFSLVTGQNLSEQGKETLEMEFKLDDQFQLLGEYDEYDAWNAGLRWRAIRRKAKKESDDEIQEVSE